MTIGFMQHWPKEMAMQDDKTYFIEKINLGLCKHGLIKRIDYVDSLEEYRSKFGDNWDWKPRLLPKIHTIRKDENDRWTPGKDIHFVVNGRTKDRFQFAPVMKCVSVQTIEVIESNPINSVIVNGKGIVVLFEHEHYGVYKPFFVKVDGKLLDEHEIKTLAQNDGFESVEDFFNYFDKDFRGKLIHWTNRKY